MVVSDNGTKLTGNAIVKWHKDRKVAWHCIAPAKPMQNGFVETGAGRAVAGLGEVVRFVCTGFQPC